MSNDQKFYGLVYKTILPDGRYYIGQHKINNHSTLDPYYVGSGVIIKDYIKQGWIPRRGICSGWQAFNLTTGNGTTREVQNIGDARSGVNNPIYGKTHTDEYKEKLRKRMSEYNINSALYREQKYKPIGGIYDY